MAIKNNISLKNKLLAELIANNNSKFRKDRKLKTELLNNPSRFNLTGLIEETMADCSDGAYEHYPEENKPHEDHTDGTDTKTGTLYIYETQAFAEISNVRSDNGVLKSGALRCVVLNPRLEKLHYVFVPKKAVHSMMHTKAGDPTKSKSAKFTYTAREESFRNFFETHGIIEVSTFKQLAMIDNH